MPPSPPISVIFGLCSFFCVFLGYASLMRRVLNSHIVPIFLVSSLVVVSYFAFLFGVYPIVLPMIKIGGLLLFIAALLPWKPVFRAKSIILESRNNSFLSRLDALFRPTSFFWIGAFIASALIIRYDIMPENRDNFNHWIVYAKWLLLNQQLPTADVTTYLAYVPGSSIQQVFFASFFPQSCNLFSVFLAAHCTFLWAILNTFIPRFDDRWISIFCLLGLFFLETLLLTESSLLTSAFAPIKQGVSFIALLALCFLVSSHCIRTQWKTFLSAALGYALFCLLCGLRYPILGEINVDYSLGFLFASLCCTYYTNSSSSSSLSDFKTRICLLPVLGFFILLKNNCIIFAVFFSLLVLLDSAFAAVSTRIQTPQPRRRRIAVAFLPFIITLAAVFIFHFSWREGYVAQLKNVFLNFEGPKKTSSLKKAYAQLTDKYDNKTKAFVSEFFEGAKKTAVVGMPAKGLCLVSTSSIIFLCLAASFILVILSLKESFFKTLVFFGVLNTCFLINFLLLLVSFVLFFSCAFNLTAYFTGRYAAHFLYPWILIVCGVACFRFSNSRTGWKTVLTGCIPVFFVAWFLAFANTSLADRVKTKKITLASFSSNLQIAKTINESIAKDAESRTLADFANKKEVQERPCKPQKPVYTLAFLKETQSKAAPVASFFHGMLKFFVVDENGNFAKVFERNFPNLERSLYKDFDYLLSLHDKKTEKKFLEMAKDYLPPDYEGGTCLFRIEKTVKPKPDEKPFRLVPVPCPAKIPMAK